MILIYASGCASKQDLLHKEVETPQDWHYLKTHKSAKLSYSKLPVVQKKWWEKFNDQNLNIIVEKVVEANLDLKIAQESLKKSQYLAVYNESALFPQVNANADIMRADSHQYPPPRNKKFSYGLSAGWELDLFAVNRNKYYSQYYLTMREEALLNDTLISLIANTVSAYIDYRMNQQLKKNSLKNYQLQAKIHQLTKMQRKRGIASNLPVLQSNSSMMSLESEIPTFDSGMAHAKLHLESLAGCLPGELNSYLNKASSLPVFQKKILISTPLNVVRNRPDIKAAEYYLMSKTSLKKSAFGQYFPSIDISGALGKFAHTLGSTHQSWQYGSSLILPLVNFGKIKSSVNYAKSDEREAALALEKAVIDSIIEVERNFVNLKNLEIKQSKILKLNKNNQELLKLARKQHQNEIISFINVLEAERSFLESSSSKIQSDAKVSQAVVVLARSLAYH